MRERKLRELPEGERVYGAYVSHQEAHQDKSMGVGGCGGILTMKLKEEQTEDEGD